MAKEDLGVRVVKMTFVNRWLKMTDAGHMVRTSSIQRIFLKVSIDELPPSLNRCGELFRMKSMHFVYGST